MKGEKLLMKVSRRGFLKVTGAASSGAFLSCFGSKSAVKEEVPKTEAPKEEVIVDYGKETTTICPYCAVGCSAIVTAKNGKVFNIEGDPDHPINEGSLCSKGSALYQVANNHRRLTKVKYRAPGSAHWEEKSWNWAVNRIATLIKNSRDAGLADGRKDNSIDTIAALGGAALDNEECYLYSKFMRALGVRYIEHQARI